jgi:hypothetical protein
MSEYVPDDDWAVDDAAPRPTHLTRTLWRYMSLSHFLWMLQNQMLWLSARARHHATPNPAIGINQTRGDDYRSSTTDQQTVARNNLY